MAVNRHEIETGSDSGCLRACSSCCNTCRKKLCSLAINIMFMAFVAVAGYVALNSIPKAKSHLCMHFDCLMIDVDLIWNGTAVDGLTLGLDDLGDLPDNTPATCNSADLRMIQMCPSIYRTNMVLQAAVDLGYLDHTKQDIAILSAFRANVGPFRQNLLKLHGREGFIRQFMLLSLAFENELKAKNLLPCDFPTIKDSYVQYLASTGHVYKGPKVRATKKKET